MNELVLIVDDEPGIVTALGNILQDEGYRVVATGSGAAAVEIFGRERPRAVFLDIWLPDLDGLEVLRRIRELDAAAAVVMISGHGSATAAVKAIKLGAFDYLEKPLAYERVMAALSGALAQAVVVPGLDSPRPTPPPALAGPPAFSLVKRGKAPQRTIKAPTVIYGLGLHSGTRTGMAIQPLPPDSGIHFETLPAGIHIPAHISAVGDTEYATTLKGGGEEIRTVEHFLAALHAAGITNLLIKVHGEVPVLDGSAVEFCQRLEAIGIADQGVARREVVIDRRYEIQGRGEKSLVIEPSRQLVVAYRLRYPPPIGEQFASFTLSSFESFQEAVAPARTFGFLKDIPMMNELGLGSGGRLDNFILVGEDNVINTALRFPDEFVRHKILDLIGDFYLLGFPLRGKITASLTGHRDNIALQRLILKECQAPRE
jgi:UDP-3-O-[3-hydroxymyristoyl] N-acetylglucosamine deacetylase